MLLSKALLYKHHGEYWEKFPITQYLNSVCKFILCWGEYSKNIFDQHTNAKKYITGRLTFQI